MDTIKFANGETHECTFISTIPDGATNRAFIALDGVSFAEAAAIFSDESKTSRMEWGDYVLVGYTTLQSLGVMPYGIQAILLGGHDERKE